MAHFAQLDENNVVTQVIVVNNNELKSNVVVESNGNIMTYAGEDEAKGVAFCKTLYGAGTNWKQTSYSGSFRGKYAGIGDTFENGVFVAPFVAVSTEQVQVLATEQLQSLSSAQVQALSTAQVQSLSTAQISQLGV